jgi:hypothetical protein
VSITFQTRTIGGVPLLLATPGDAAPPPMDEEVHRKELRQHLMAEAHWNRAMDEAVGWLSLHLR